MQRKGIKEKISEAIKTLGKRYLKSRDFQNTKFIELFAATHNEAMS
jgi:hypothetical protein